MGSGWDAAGSAPALILSEPSQGCLVAPAPRSRLETFQGCASQAFSILDDESVCYLRRVDSESLLCVAGCLWLKGWGLAEGRINFLDFFFFLTIKLTLHRALLYLAVLFSHSLKISVCLCSGACVLSGVFLLALGR